MSAFFPRFSAVFSFWHHDAFIGSYLFSLFFSRLGAVFCDFECIRVANSDFKHFGGSIFPLSLSLSLFFFFFFLLLSHKFFYMKPLGVFIKLYKQPWVGSMIFKCKEIMFFFFFLVLTFFFKRLEIKIEALCLCWIFFFFFFWFRRVMRFFSKKLFVVACFCYTACFSWQLSCTNTYLFNAASSRVFVT